MAGYLLDTNVLPAVVRSLNVIPAEDLFTSSICVMAKCRPFLAREDAARHQLVALRGLRSRLPLRQFLATAQ